MAAFLELTDLQRPLGTLVFELFEDECPNTCYNFRMLCSGELGLSTLSKRPLHYKGTSIFRIVPGMAIQGGDIVNDNGTSGESVFGTIFFEDEFSRKPHDRPGLLCSASLGRPNTNTSQFYITTGPCHWQDGRDIVFGRVISGLQTLANLDLMGSANGTVSGSIKISNCGIISSEENELKVREDIEYTDPPRNVPYPSSEQQPVVNDKLSSGIFGTGSDYHID